MKPISFLSLLILTQLSFGQITLILQPDGVDGKDAFLDSRVSDYMGGDHYDFLACAWTNGGVPVDCRGLLEFDLSEVPPGSTLISAKLYLYGYNSPSNTGHYSAGTGTNACYLQKITEPWNEATVSWDTQPASTTVGQVTIPGSVSENQDFEVNVTDLVQDMVDNPAENYGFLFRLITEERYNSLLFASSDNENPDLRPKLVVVYRAGQSSIDETELNLSLFPNPATSNLNVELSQFDTDTKLLIYNSAGQFITAINQVKNKNVFDISNYAPGIYFLRLVQGNAVVTRKFVVRP